MRNEWKAIFPRNYDKRPRVRVRVRVTCPECAKQVLPANASQEKGRHANLLRHAFLPFVIKKALLGWFVWMGLKAPAAGEQRQ